MIWLETNQHVIELMTDPFGNYLCQKLLEFCNDDERTILIQNASQDMVRIALNQHGTRALQKMIEFVSTPHQVHLIIEALRFRVVELIQDLNGNRRADTNFVGMPTEPWGVSNGVRPTMRAPRFDEAAFVVGDAAGETVVDVKVSK